MKAKEIRDLIDFISQSGLNEVHIKTEEFEIKVKRQPEISVAPSVIAPAPMIHHQAAPAPQVNVAPKAEESTPAPKTEESTPAAKPAVSDESKYVAVKSPMIGTFYRASSPDAAPFAKVGDTIKKGQAVCVIEAMKLFNEIESEVSGTIVKVLVDNASPVEYDQTLFLVDPA